MDIRASRHAALGTLEIVENILSFLPLENIFGVQRVCRGWKNIIASSPALQEKMFLRLRNDTSETWMLIDSKSVPCNVDNLPEGSEINFRTVSTAEAESGAWKNPSRGVKHLFTPVALNPLLYREDPLLDDLKEIEGVGHAFAVGVPAEYSPHHSYRAMHLTDPPCRDGRMDLMYDVSRSAPNGYRYNGSMATVRSNKPLTLGDLIDGALDSRDMYRGKEGTAGRYDGTISEKFFYLAKETDEMGKNHRYRLVFQNERDGIGLPINEFTFCPLLLTEDEYLCLQPAEDLLQ
jgi:hypothetical protein